MMSYAARGIHASRSSNPSLSRAGEGLMLLVTLSMSSGPHVDMLNVDTESWNTAYAGTLEHQTDLSNSSDLIYLSSLVDPYMSYSRPENLLKDIKKRSVTLQYLFLAADKIRFRGSLEENELSKECENIVEQFTDWILLLQPKGNHSKDKQPKLVNDLIISLYWWNLLHNVTEMKQLHKKAIECFDTYYIDEHEKDHNLMKANTLFVLASLFELLKINRNSPIIKEGEARSQISQKLDDAFPSTSETETSAAA